MKESTNSINLLPQWAKDAKKRRKTIFALVGVQVVIFLLLYTTVSVFYLMESLEFTNTIDASKRIRALNPIWEQTAADVSTAMARQTQIEEFFELHGTYWFEPHWLYAAVNATPSQAQLIRLEYSNAQFLLISTSTDISVAEVHRHEIAVADFFYSAIVGSITGLGDGHYSYELRIVVHE